MKTKHVIEKKNNTKQAKRMPCSSILPGVVGWVWDRRGSTDEPTATEEIQGKPIPKSAPHISVNIMREMIENRIPENPFF